MAGRAEARRLSRRAGTPTVDPRVVVYVLPLTAPEAQLVARAVRQLVVQEGASVTAEDVLAMLDRPLELRSLVDVLV